jgi:hypothetical protein
MRSGDVLFLTDSLYTKTPEDSKWVRLMSNVTYERRGDLQWLVAGDTFASSGELGSTVNIGGLSFAKLYRLDPIHQATNAQCVRCCRAAVRGVGVS